jgi:glutamate dehydrogenase/leucine dehydrogenase
VSGGANNQLRSPRDGDALLARGITYVPDYVANAGGVLSGAGDLLGWPAEQVRGKIEGIFETTLEVLESARREGLPPGEVADRMAWRRIDEKRQNA